MLFVFIKAFLNIYLNVRALTHTSGLYSLFCPAKGHTCLCSRPALVQRGQFCNLGWDWWERSGDASCRALHPWAQEPHASSGLCQGYAAAVPGPGHISTILFVTLTYWLLCPDLRRDSLLPTSLVIPRLLPVPEPNLPHSELSPLQVFSPLCWTMKFLILSICHAF